MPKIIGQGTYLARWWDALLFFLLNNVFFKFTPYWMRHAYLRKVIGIGLGKDSSVAMSCFVTGNDIRIGNNTAINRFCYLDGRGPLYIGNNVNVSHYTLIHTLTHIVNSPYFHAQQRPVAIMDDAWIGARAIILPGVTIGQGAVVAAGAVVSRDVPPYAIVSGNPAQVVGERTRDLRYKTRYFPFFDTDIQ
ncbi:DapH/DapD/GlmU-related protein [Novosphingobium sp. CECT 9465]|uniref:acyltransferase n=1 Tax=Novosphingobium sp. CECT 9465 TaxID=2829794 RepID=UPI001E33A03F|nr:acyltransferase [Novosphingobium sp. CECT 9465]CAH0497199.1 2,3,4,5-tetrahydropyridine-2,6-dicarboxylate N-acetyltransferase [Novosphingobium sp. CECT 9465]